MHRSPDVPRTCLVSMPWHSLNRPSLALGILRAACAREGLPVPVSYHGSLQFASVMVQAGFTVGDYAALADTGYHYSLGEWVFAGALYQPEFGYAGMRDLARRHDLPMRTAAAVRELAEPFVEQTVTDILATDPDLVEFSCTFSQTVASLAVATRIKQRRPDVAILLGGYSADGPMGQALHREFECVDYVLRGEADVAFPHLLTALATGSAGALEKVPNLCWRDGNRSVHVNTRPAVLVPPVKMPPPDYGDWFEVFPPELAAHIVPELVVESSRGCWWGEKHHCTFCGLNGTGMTHRAKPADTFVTEVTDLVRRHQVLDVTMIDNILPSDYYTTALPDFADTDYDWKFHYEIKANVKIDDIATLRAARVWGIQPGIESLIDDVLRRMDSRMDKGVRSVHNVRMIRDGCSAGLSVTWNWLYGFPGERQADYEAVIAQLPALAHLQPPTDCPASTCNGSPRTSTTRRSGSPTGGPPRPPATSTTSPPNDSKISCTPSTPPTKGSPARKPNRSTPRSTNGKPATPPVSCPPARSTARW
jgi:ribosomal peptide maturation radical SAM protein 1